MKRCMDCGQPMLPSGVEKKPNEYDHAGGCPVTKIERLKLQVDELSRQLRAQEITAINERLRTARECAEIAEEHEDDGTAMDIRDRFGVTA